MRLVSVPLTPKQWLRSPASKGPYPPADGHVHESVMQTRVLDADEPAPEGVDAEAWPRQRERLRALLEGERAFERRYGARLGSGFDFSTVLATSVVDDARAP